MSRFLLASIIILSISIPVWGQDAEEQTCTPDQWQEFQDLLVEIGGRLVESEAPIETVLELDALVAVIQATCGGGVFSKADHPNGIIGPIAFSGSLYEATLESTGSLAILTPTVVEGDCGLVFGMPTMTGMSGGSQGNIWEFNNCTAIFKIEAPMAQDWSLIIKRLR